MTTVRRLYRLEWFDGDHDQHIVIEAKNRPTIFNANKGDSFSVGVGDAILWFESASNPDIKITDARRDKPWTRLGARMCGQRLPLSMTEVTDA